MPAVHQICCMGNSSCTSEGLCFHSLFRNPTYSRNFSYVHNFFFFSFSPSPIQMLFSIFAFHFSFHFPRSWTAWFNHANYLSLSQGVVSLVPGLGWGMSFLTGHLQGHQQVADRINCQVCLGNLPCSFTVRENTFFSSTIYLPWN